ncbi:MAG: isoleucine--tRNA ligase [Cytophagales bacterium]|nr:isoleucine--tRNA ligase [Cytophagales bacterium]
MKFSEYKGINFARVAEEILAKWQSENTFEESITSREGNPTFTFFEGPPSANGMPGIHHVMARTVKDIVCRYKTLKGFQVKRKGGWDTHGLPVELQVEKNLGITKEDIGTKISVEDYNKACRESVMEFKSSWDDLTQQMGYWVDLDNPYITFDKEYMESIWYLLKELYKKDFLYKGLSIQPYSPAAGTGLSSHELNQPGCYRDVKDTTIVAQFKVKGKDNEFFLAWTTTPWTLPSNSALAVGKGITYVKVKTYNQYTHQPIEVILAKDRVNYYFNAKAQEVAYDDYKGGDKLIPWEIVEECKGSDLEGIEYEQLLPYVQPDKPAFKVIIGDFVTTADGTGIVHIAPTFGADDKRVADLAGIPGITVKDDQDNDVPLVNKQGCFVDEVTDFANEPVKQEYLDEITEGYKNVDIRISIKLKEENKAFKVEKYEHSYPHCWRTDKPVLYYPLDSWFIRTTAVKDRLVELNNTINWIPESTGSGRFGNWLENLVDWNLSRSRYWGTPLPIWSTKDGETQKCIGSVNELAEEIKKANEVLEINADTLAQKEEELGTKIHNLNELEDLHRPYADWVVLVSDEGEPMFRETDLIDVWFDSGAMPYAQWHYMGESEKLEGNFPADFIAEGVDQTRGWFFTLHAIATMLFDDVAFKNVIANGLVLAKDGQKMSKRLGNGVNPFDAIAKYGPDAVRWYMISNAQPYENLKFNIDGVGETQRRFFGTFHNTYNFFALYANLDGFTYQEEALPLAKRTESDRWVLSKLHSLVKRVDELLNDYDLTNTAREIQDFVSNDLSNWYVRLNRKRFWKGEYNEDKKAAYQTLAECLSVTAQISSIIAPFYFDKVYADLNSVMNAENLGSVHLSTYPEANEEYIDLALEQRMEYAQRISSSVHALRKGEKLKVRQPLSKVLIPVLNDEFKTQIEAVEDLICTEVNIKGIEYLADDENSILVKKIKPNFRKLGQQFGKNMKVVAGLINQMSQEDISAIERNNAFEIEVAGEKHTLTAEDVEINFQDIEGWLVASDSELTVALDITLTENLKQEGFARDVVNRIQNLRKESGLEIQDKINITILAENEWIKTALEANQTYVCTETQALSLNFTPSVENGTVLEIDEHQLTLTIEK